MTQLPSETDLGSLEPFDPFEPFRGMPTGADPTVIGFHSPVQVRWSDMDAYQHINHARMVTLLEEARIPFLFVGGSPTAGMRSGLVVVEASVRYREQIRHDEGPLDVLVFVERLRAVDFTIGYEVRPRGVGIDRPAAVTASTQMATFDIDAQRLRRITPEERAYLEQWKRT